MPNLLNPTNDPRLDEALRKGLLNFGTAFATGGVGVPGDLGQGAQDATVGLLNARQQSLDPTGRVRAMSGQHAPLQGPQVPFSSESMQRQLGGDPASPMSLLGYIGAPEVTDVSKIVAAAAAGKGGLLAQALFHGTPHKFSKFELEKIGTGEGAQSYGHGLYFAESPGVAKSYQQQLLGGVQTPGAMRARDMVGTTGSEEAALKSLRKLRDSQRAGDAVGKEMAAETQQAIDAIKSQSYKGHLYEVDIPDETIAKMLDWDAPLSEQPEILSKLPDGFLDDMQADFDVPIESMSGGHFYEEVARTGDISTVEGASDFLNEAGIPGIRFYDGASRGKGEGTRNIVVFNPDDIASVKRDGELVYDTGKSGGLLDNLKPVKSRLDAERHWEDPNETIYAINEMDEVPSEVTSLDMLNAYTPDQLYVAPKGGLLGTRVADDVPLQDTVRAALADDATALGFKKVKKTGAYVGAPPGVKGDDDIVRLAEEYADRVQRALDAGVDKDYFYLKGQRAIEGVTDDATTARHLADANAITSSEAPVRNNYGWSVQAFEQRAAGMPVRTGKYPVEASDKIETIFKGGEPHLGEKRHLYGQGLSGEGRKLPEELRNAPNDRWEIRGFGYDKDSAGPAQHKFMHGVRRIAKDIVNKRLGTDLDIYNVQELNWATTRADSMGISIPESATDTIQAAIPQYRFQHSWETVPGKNLLDVDMPAHDKALRDIYLDEGGKDKLIRNFGGELQEPALQNVPGVFEGNVNPYGYQSRSQAYHAGGKLADSSTDRIKATETTRSFMNLQDAAAGSLITPSKRKTVKPFGGALRFDLGRPINQDEAQQVVDTLRKYHGINDFGVVPNAGGADILATGAKGLEKQGEELHGLLGSQGVMSDFSGTGFYAELPWDERKATETMLDSMTPAMRNRADSDEMRVMAGQLYDYYKGLPNDPPKGFREVLKTWATDGIDGVQDLVKKGLAPAGVLGILVGAQLKQEETDHGLL